MLTKKLQLLGDFISQTRSTMALPLDPVGGLPTPRPPAVSYQPWRQIDATALNAPYNNHNNNNNNNTVFI